MPWIPSQGLNVLKQKEERSCGLCCVGMANNIYHPNDFLSEQSLVTRSAQIGTGGRDRYYKAAVDMPGARPTQWAIEFPKLGRYSEGTFGDHITSVANSYGLQASNHTGTITEMKQAMRRVQEGRRLVIVLVSWGHWVLVKSRARRWGRASIYTILDPLGTAVRNTGSTDYDNEIGKQGTFGDKQSRGWWVNITGTKPVPKGTEGGWSYG